jgi:HEAT repeat protein
MIRRWRAVIGAGVLSLGLLAPSASATVWPSSHERVADALDSGDLTERRRAASRLSTLPPALAKTLAVRAIRDGDPEVRIYGARAAAALGVDKAGDEVIGWLQNRDARLRLAACELIEASPTPQSIQALARVLGDAKASVRKAAATAMGGSGLADAVGPLLGHLDDGSGAVRFEVVRALGRIGDKRAVVPLVSKLQDQRTEVRREAARALGRLGDERASATLMLALQDKEVAVRVQALDALGRLGVRDATTAIAALLENQSASGQAGRGPVRDAALRALGRIGDSQGIRLLVRALESEGPTVDQSRPSPVREALALAGEPAVEALLATLEASPSRRLASAAVLALAELNATRARGAIVRAARRGVVELDAGLRALGALGDSAALPFVLEHVDDVDAQVRHTVVTVAARLLDPKNPDGRAVDVVRERARDLTAPLGERMALVRLLGRTGSPAARDLLLSLAKSKPTALRIEVMSALGELGVEGREVDAVLLEALTDPSPRLRMTAAGALGLVGRDAAASELLHRLDVSAEQDRAAIGMALSAVLGRSTQPAIVDRVTKALASATGPSRDALIEGLGRMGQPAAVTLLGEIGKSPNPDDRRKVAEALGSSSRSSSSASSSGTGASAAERALVASVGDADPTVRANAAWSLGKVGGAASVTALVQLVGDLDVAVAGNASVALGRVAARGTTAPSIGPALCKASEDFRSYVRAGALVALRGLPAATCPAASVRRLLHRDRSWRARAAAADLLWRVSSDANVSEQERQLASRALWRCAVEDRDASVAERCDERPRPTAPERDDVLVFVVSDGKTEPTARAPFALVLADGSMRLGVADRRGAAFEAGAPAGTLELAVPAALAQ